MPARELEVLGVLPFQLLADVVERMRLAILAEAGVVVRQMHLDDLSLMAGNCSAILLFPWQGNKPVNKVLNRLVFDQHSQL